MICPKCKTPNPEEAVYCAGCGRPLLRQAGSRKAPLRPLLFAAGAAAALVIIFLIYRQFAAPEAAPERTEAKAASDLRVQAAEGSLAATYGDMFVRKGAGREAFRTTVAVFDGDRVALPVAGLIGGEDLTFQADGSASRPVSRGAWGTGDPIAFFEVESGYPAAPLALAAWRPSLPLEWYPCRSADPPLNLEVEATRKAGSFECFTVPPEVRAPGLFVQEGAVVGWTFGRPFDQGYVWPGTPAAGPLPAIGADKFFSAISSDCREGYFRRLFDSGVEKSPAAELEALAEGFRRAPLLAPEDLPPDLRQSAVVARMEALASDLIEGGQAAEVVRILDDQILRESADPVLAVTAVAAQAEGQDYNRTMRRLEAIERDVFAPRGLVPEEIRELKARLYKDWLRKIIEKGDYYSGQVAFEEALRAFPDDPEIRLLGVEIAISENDPARARELLADGDYPAELRGRVERMGARLEEASEDAQEEILLPFNPAADHISVEAVINGFYRQSFIVDTGANVVTIPAAAAQALGFTVDDTLPATTLLTAGGALHAYEVALESIQLADLRVDKVKALVVDLPASPEHGLLGLNFFDAFRAEIDRANGVLRLKRRSPIK